MRSDGGVVVDGVGGANFLAGPRRAVRLSLVILAEGSTTGALDWRGFLVVASDLDWLWCEWRGDNSWRWRRKVGLVGDIVLLLLLIILNLLLLHTLYRRPPPEPSRKQHRPEQMTVVQVVP